MKVIIVTGAAGNLGQAIVKKFLDEGCNVIGTITPGSTPPDFNNKLFEAVAVDLTHEGETGKFIANVIEKCKTIDVAVLTVGGFAAGKIADTNTDAMMHQYKLNVQTTY